MLVHYSWSAILNTISFSLKAVGLSALQSHSLGKNRPPSPEALTQLCFPASIRAKRCSRCVLYKAKVSSTNMLQILPQLRREGIVSEAIKAPEAQSRAQDGLKSEVLGHSCWILPPPWPWPDAMPGQPRDTGCHPCHMPFPRGQSQGRSERPGWASSVELVWYAAVLHCSQATIQADRDQRVPHWHYTPICTHTWTWSSLWQCHFYGNRISSIATSVSQEIAPAQNVSIFLAVLS